MKFQDGRLFLSNFSTFRKFSIRRQVPVTPLPGPAPGDLVRGWLTLPKAVRSSRRRPGVSWRVRLDEPSFFQAGNFCRAVEKRVFDYRKTTTWNFVFS